MPADRGFGTWKILGRMRVEGDGESYPLAQGAHPTPPTPRSAPPLPTRHDPGPALSADTHGSW